MSGSCSISSLIGRGKNNRCRSRVRSAWSPDRSAYPWTRLSNSPGSQSAQPRNIKIIGNNSIYVVSGHVSGQRGHQKGQLILRPGHLPLQARRLLNQDKVVYMNRIPSTCDNNITSQVFLRVFLCAFVSTLDRLSCIRTKCFIEKAATQF